MTIKAAILTDEEIQALVKRLNDPTALAEAERPVKAVLARAAREENRILALSSVAARNRFFR